LNAQFAPQRPVWRGNKLKWKDHTRIAQLVATAFNLPTQPLTEGAVAPDKFRVAHEPHHAKDIEKIMRELKTARKFYLNGKIPDLSYQLGVALHYIQDACVGKGFLGISHEDIENEVSSLRIPVNAVKAGLDNYQPHPFKLREALKALNNSSSSPNEILWNAVYYSFLAARSVLEPGNRDSVRKEAEKLNEKMKKSLLYALQANLAMLYIAIFIPLKVFALALFLFLVTPPLLYAILLYFKSQKEELKEWFGWFKDAVPDEPRVVRVVMKILE